MLNSVTNKGLTCVNDQKIHSLNVDSNVWFNHVDIMDSPSASGSQGRHLCQFFSLVMYNTYLQPRYSMTAGALGGGGLICKRIYHTYGLKISLMFLLQIIGVAMVTFAAQYPDDILKYVNKEIQLGAMLGPSNMAKHMKTLPCPTFISHGFI